jgi:phosphoglycerol transferase MdoB-like AlkP superfamily enzyme
MRSAGPFRVCRLIRRTLLGSLVLIFAAAVTAGADDIGAEHDLAVGPLHLTSPLETASTYRIPVEIRNRGRSVWSAESGFALAYHWFGTNGEVAVWDGVRTPFVEPLAPQVSTIVDANLRTPDRAGRYLLQWDVVQEGKLWVSRVDPTPVDREAVSVVATHAFSFLEVETPRVLRSRGGRRCSVVVRNDGTRGWPGDGSVSLSYHWLTAAGEIADWEGRRTAVPRAVEPGESIRLDALVAAPDASGRFALQWDMVEEGVCWFSERDGSPEPLVTVLVVPMTIVDPFLWTLLVVAGAGLAVALSRRGRLTRGWAVADVVWCCVAVLIKQSWVMAGAGLVFSAAGWWLGCATMMLMASVLLLVAVRWRPWVSWLTVFVTTAVLFADLVYLRFFDDLVSVAALHSASQIGRVEASVRSLLDVGDLWFWADLPVAIVLIRAVAGARLESGRRRRLVAAFGMAAVASAAIGGVALRSSDVSFLQVFNTTSLARQIGVLNVHAMDLGRSMAGKLLRRGLDDDEVREVERFFADRRGSRAGSGPFFGAAKGRNLVMVQVESLQAFVIGFRVGGREVTPFLNSLAAHNIFFGNVTDQTEEGRSSDAELATQVSLLPLDRGAAAFLHAENHYTGLASALREHGYETLSAVAFEGSFWNRRVTHRSYGYSRSLFADEFRPGETIGWGLNDRDFLTQAVERLADLPEPWCAYLLTLSLHHPFDGFPDHLKVLDVGDWEGTPFGNYLHTMHYFDRALADFITALDSDGLLDHTVIALWGDHDAGFEWRSEIAAAVGFAHDAAGWYLSQQVPLVIRVPGEIGSDGPLAVPAGHADVAPTLLALLGVDPAPFAFIGRNLLGSPGPGPVVGEYRCWRDTTHLYLRRGPLLSDGECIELATMKRVGVEACSASFEEARREVEVSRLVLEYDLQSRLRRP